MTKGAVLITGGGQRIGKELSIYLGKRGYSVAVHYGTSEQAAAVVAQTILENGGQAITVGADLCDAARTRSLIPRAAKKLGAPVTGLINNAAAFQKDTLENLDDESFDSNLTTNLKAPLLLSQAFAKALPDGMSGSIINIIDQRVLKVSIGYLSYTISKHALLTLTRILAVELGPAICVNGIGPGPTLPSVHQTGEDFAAEVKSLPLGRGPRLSEIAATAGFLLETPAMTGQMIALDGGQHLL